MMSAKDAELVLLKIGNGASPAEEFATLAGLRTTRMIVNRQVVVATDVTSGQWREALQQAGTAFLRIQGAGVFTDSAAESILRVQALGGTASNYQFFFGNGDVLEGAFVVSNYERSGKIGDMEAFAMTLESAAAISYTEA